MTREEIISDLKEFFYLLDLTEESEEGRIFHPTVIRTVRALDGVKMDTILRRLKGEIDT